MVFFRFVAAVILVGLLAVVGVNIYNAGVSAGIAFDVGNAIASGAPVPAGYYHGPYAGQPWHGFGFGGFLLGILFLFFFFGLLRAIFGWGRWGGITVAITAPVATAAGGTNGRWHEEQHGKAPDAPATGQDLTRHAGPMRAGGRRRPPDLPCPTGTHPRRR